MQRGIIVRQTNVDVRATSAERAVYFWQWAGNLAGSLRIREQVRGVGARAGHKEALQSQLAITQIQVSFHSATACLYTGVLNIGISLGSEIESRRGGKSALCYKKRRNRVRIESVIPKESFTKARFTEEARKRWNKCDEMIFFSEEKVIECWGNNTPHLPVTALS